mgnify:CR=1 FL=1
MEIVSSKKTKLAKPGFVFIQTVVMKTLYSVPHNFNYEYLVLNDLSDLLYDIHTSLLGFISDIRHSLRSTLSSY